MKHTFPTLESQLSAMPARERRALAREPYASCLRTLLAPDADADPDTEPESPITLTCATSASLGRGVLVLTRTTLRFAGTRTNPLSWDLGDLQDIGGRAANFTLPAALYLELPSARLVFIVGSGRTWGPHFVQDAKDARLALASHELLPAERELALA